MRFEVKMKWSWKMACVTVRDLPAKTLSALKKRAGMNHRSLNGEILYIFDRVVSGLSEFDVIRETRAARQLAALRDVAGKWVDDRSAEEIIAEIEGARTPGREVDFDIA